MPSGTVVAIYYTDKAGAAVRAVEDAHPVPGPGLEGLEQTASTTERSGTTSAGTER